MGRRISSSVLYLITLCSHVSQFLYLAGQVLGFTQESKLLEPDSVITADLQE